MGRLTAWIASRRQTRRLARAHRHKSAGTAARPLGFERYEERIALSTNAALDLDFAENFYVKTVDVSEGGWIDFRANVAGDSFLTWSNSYPRVLMTSGSGHVSRLGLASLDDTTGVNILWSEPTAAGFDYTLAADADSAELLLTDSRVVPIPPPSSGPGGNEGGQISMTPFMGPATLGLPSAGDSLYASKDRPALQPESVETATDVPSATPADSLRGRAVVYEVAHADSRLKSERDRLDDASLAKLEANSAWSATRDLNLASQTSVVADGRETASRVKLPADDSGNASHQLRRDDAAVLRVVETAVRSPKTVEPEVADNAAPPAAALEAAAQDAAFEQWQNELAPALEGREVAAAADTQQRRVLGAALVVLGAIPVTKAMRRHSQQDSAAHRPRQRRPVPPISRE